MPPKAVVVNFGVFFFHLNETVTIAIPREDKRPTNIPIKSSKFVLLYAIKKIPVVAINIEIHVVAGTFSLIKMNGFGVWGLPVAAWKGVHPQKI